MKIHPEFKLWFSVRMWGFAAGAVVMLLIFIETI